MGEFLKVVRTEVFCMSILDFCEIVNYSAASYHRLETNEFGKKFSFNKDSILNALSKPIADALHEDEGKLYKINEVIENFELCTASKAVMHMTQNELREYVLRILQILTGCSQFELERNIKKEVLKKAAKSTGLLNIYNHRSELSSNDFISRLKKASSNIDLLGHAIHFIPEHFEFKEVLENTSAEIRICLSNPNSKYVFERNLEEKNEGSIAARISSSLLRINQIQSKNLTLKLHETPLYCSIFRFDNEMFVTPHLYGLRGASAPMMHLENNNNGLYNSYLKHFNDIWLISNEYDLD
jgi:hypothetical protein